MFFLRNFEHLNENGQQLFDIFKNIIAEKKFQYLDDKLLTLLAKFILNFSYTVTKNSNWTPSSTLSRQELCEVRNCVELIEKLSGHLTTIECVNYVVLSLCELLNLVWLNQASRDSQISLFNSEIISLSYEVSIDFEWPLLITLK